ncbi:MAG: YcnI family protein [Gloeobacterales cyanobacterium]
MRRFLNHRFLLGFLSVFLLSEQANAHAVVSPAQSEPGKLQMYTLEIPSESPTSPTSEIRLKIPKGLRLLYVQPVAGWTRQFIEEQGQVTEVIWKGSLEPQEFQMFIFKARNPVEATPLVWKVLQRYKDGTTSDWSGPPNSATPASMTKIQETTSKDSKAQTSNPDMDMEHDHSKEMNMK